jgi:hypothetical protein
MTKTLPLIVSTLGLALTACGDNRAPAPDAGPVDVASGPPRAVIVAGDFTAGHPGVLSTLDLATRTVTPDVGPRLAVGDDPILRHVGGELFIVNRSDGNNVTILNDQTLALKEQLGTGPGSNPQDVAVVGQKLYVATFGGTGLVVLARGATTVTAIDLSKDDPDGKPNCNSVYLVGSNVYVSCGLLDDTDQNLPPRGPGKVYVVDTATNAIKATLTLTTPNPVGLFEQIPAAAPNNASELVMPTAVFPAKTGCVERITTGAAATAPGCLMSNADLGGYAGRIAFQLDKEIAITWIAAQTTYPKGDLRAYDMPTSALWAGPINAAGEQIGDVALCPSGEIVVTDTTVDPTKTDPNGLRLYDGAAELTKSPLPIGLPPLSLHGLVCY